MVVHIKGELEQGLCFVAVRNVADEIRCQACLDTKWVVWCENEPTHSFLVKWKFDHLHSQPPKSLVWNLKHGTNRCRYEDKSIRVFERPDNNKPTSQGMPKVIISPQRGFLLISD